MSDVRKSSPPTLVRGILVAHGSMAEGLVDALRRISGTDEEAVRTLSNEARGPEELAALVDEIAGEAPAVVFTDLHSGSCTMAARLACRGTGRRAVVCGANLPMLLDFVFHRALPLDELVDRLVSTGRGAIVHFPGDEVGKP